jgi:hypothetical protein
MVEGQTKSNASDGRHTSEIWKDLNRDQKHKVIPPMLHIWSSFQTQIVAEERDDQT